MLFATKPRPLIGLDRGQVVLSSCINCVHSRWGYAFSVRMCIPGESHPHSWWGISPCPVRMCTTGEAHPHSRWSTSTFSVRMCIPSEDVHFRWVTSPFPVRHIPIPGENVNSIVIHPHQEWGCVSSGMHIVYTGCLLINSLQYQRSRAVCTWPKLLLGKTRIYSIFTEVWRSQNRLVGRVPCFSLHH